MFCFLKFICMDSAYLRKPRASTRFFSAWDSEGRNPLLWYVRGNVDKHTNVPIIQFNELCTAGTLLTQPPTATIKRCHQSCHLPFPFPSSNPSHTFLVWVSKWELLFTFFSLKIESCLSLNQFACRPPQTLQQPLLTTSRCCDHWKKPRHLHWK